MSEFKRFIFVGYDANLAGGEASFHYSIQSENKTQDFTDKIFFSPVNLQLPNKLVALIMNNLLLVLGISYWKLYCPPTIEIKSFSITQKQAEFWNAVYTKGLGELFFRNKIDFRGLINFPFKEIKAEGGISFSKKNRYLVPIGGGKDSIVTSELLKKEGKDFDILIIGDSQISQEVASVIGKIPIIVKRKIDPTLIELSKTQNTYNGHVPVSAAIAFISLMEAIFCDYKYILVSNEKSASFGNLEYLGQEINHQWSKSEEFEHLFRNYVEDFITPDIEYSSYLRQMDEFEITKIFSKYKQYFDTFSSCNRNFRLDPKRRNIGKKWCGECPKCLFVFILLSAFISKRELLGIFGKNLFEDKNLLTLFKETIGLVGFKPFECVGTPEEAKKALEIAYKKGEFNGDFLMEYFQKEVLNKHDK